MTSPTRKLQESLAKVAATSRAVSEAAAQARAATASGGGQAQERVTIDGDSGK